MAVGGSPGGWAAMLLFHHKTQKASFRTPAIVITLLQAAALPGACYLARRPIRLHNIRPWVVPPGGGPVAQTIRDIGVDTAQGRDSGKRRAPFEVTIATQFPARSLHCSSLHLLSSSAIRCHTPIY